VGVIRTAHARAEAQSADQARIAAEGRVEAEHREAQTQRKEASIQQMQRIRLTYQREGWREDAWGIARTLASAGHDARIQSEAAACLAGLDARKLKSFPFPGTGLAFDPSGKRLMISGSSLIEHGPEQPVRTWDRTTDQVQAANVKGDGVFAFRPDGTPLFLAIPREKPSIATLWDLSSARLLRSFASPIEGKSAIQALSMTPEGSVVAVSAVGLDAKGKPAETGTIAVREAATGREIFRTTAQRATDIALAPDASLLAAGFEDGHISAWSLPQGKPLDRLRFDRSPIQCLSFGRDPVRGTGRTSPGYSWLLAAGARGGGVIVWDVASHTPRSICHGPTGSPEVFTLAFSPDGLTLASAGRGTVQLWDIASGQFLLDVVAGNYVTALAFSADGGRLAVGSVAAFGAPDSVNIWELEPGLGIAGLRGLSQSVFWETFSPDGRLVGALSNDWQVGIWDHAAHRLIHVLEVTPGSHTDNAALAFSPDGRRFGFSAGHEASLWDVATGELVQTWQLFEGLGDRLAFSGPDRLLLFRVETVSGELGPFGPVDPIKHPRVCRVRDLLGANPLKPVAEIRDCNLGVLESQCSPDGKYYAIEGFGGSWKNMRRVASLYEGVTGKKVGDLPTRESVQLNSAIFNFDPTGGVLNYFSVATEPWSTFLLEIPSRAVLRQFDKRPSCLGPGAKRWLVSWGFTADQPSAFSLHEQDRPEPLIRLLVDVGQTTSSTRVQFNPDGSHLVWGNPSGAVTVVDLVEVNRNLTGIGLGW